MKELNLCYFRVKLSLSGYSNREALTALFVPRHLGVNHMTRNDLISRNLLIPEGLFGNREERKPIVICDGTYIPIYSKILYYFQKKTYSLHKYRNLVKPFLIVASDGYIYWMYLVHTRQLSQMPIS